MRKVSPKQQERQDNWNRLVKFLSGFTYLVDGCYARTECCNKQVTEPMDGAHIIPKTRAGCTWTAKNCLLVSRWCGCHSHQEYGDGLRMGIVAALEIARKRNEKYGIDPDYDGSKDMNPYIQQKLK